MPKSIVLLDSLLSFKTVSADSNLQLITWIHDLLVEAGASVQLIHNADGSKANLFATTGPSEKPGFVLSGHTDVVPVDGQSWSVPPFAMTMRDGKLFGRGSADMKGFIACGLKAFLDATRMPLETPLHLALSYDEEIGCVGVRSLLDMLAQAPVRPLMCLVGEPTLLDVAVGHKGKTACRISCTGRAGHSALAPQALNAIHLASDLIQAVRTVQTQLAQAGHHDAAYEIPYTTLHVSNLAGGVALNIVPDYCQFDLEIRNLAEDDPQKILAEVRAHAQQLLNQVKEQFEEAAIDIDVFNTYPGLDTHEQAPVVGFVRSLLEDSELIKVAFGTEGGLFSGQLGIPTVVCGPGSMQQGHRPDEFVSMEQLALCDVMLTNLLKHLQRGL